MEIKEKIDVMRKARGWTLSRLAKEIGLSTTSVYNWYNEKNTNPSREAIEDVCAAFGVSVAEFYADVETDKLTEKELRLLQLFREIPDKNKDKALSMLEILLA